MAIINNSVSMIILAYKAMVQSLTSLHTYT